MAVKYIFVTGGVVSGLGKGITAASLGRLLKARGLKVTLQKFDPYLNIDTGSMSPYQHGEVYVTEDGAETDLDIGHYERFTNENLSVNSNITSGKVYWSVLNRERSGDFLGGTVQVIPHITNEIKDRVYRVGRDDCDVVITEIGGTVGDIECQPFLEAIRQVSLEVGKENVLYLHVSLIVHIPGTQEPKSKPTQHSVKALLGLGIQPDILVCRTESPLERSSREKIALFCNIPVECVIQNINVDFLYEVPLLLQSEGLDTVVCRRLGLPPFSADLSAWQEMVDRYKSAKRRVLVGIVGKYVTMPDAYLSLSESLTHGAIEADAKLDIRWINSEHLTAENADEILSGLQGIVVPGGFGERGIDGKIVAAGYARRHNIPYLGVSLGMQVAAVEFARSVCGQPQAHSTECDPATPYPVVKKTPDGQMRLNSYTTRLQPGSLAANLYGCEEISERHRHRFELNNDCLPDIEAHGLIPTGFSVACGVADILELRDHPFFVGISFHPEFKSRPGHANPLLVGFITAAIRHTPAN